MERALKAQAEKVEKRPKDIDHWKVWTIQADVDRMNVMYGTGKESMFCGQIVETGRCSMTDNGPEKIYTNTMGGWGHGEQSAAHDCARRKIVGRGIIG